MARLSPGSMTPVRSKHPHKRAPDWPFAFDVLMSNPPTTPLDPAIRHKGDRLLAIVRGCGRVAVAFSAGVDSTVVAQAARLACGDDAVAVTAVSPSLAAGELDLARQLAAQIGVRHIEIETREFAVADYQRNAGDRCYYCKTELYSDLEGLAARLGVDTIVNGANVDDLGDYRPGMQAAREHGVRSPLVEAGLTKADVRELARAWGLPVWDKPASPCLSSRIAYGVEVTPERVRRVDEAERFLRAEFGLRVLRVRLEANDLARIEVPEEVVPQLAAPDQRERIVARFAELGFRCVTLDLAGFRSGSLNAALPVVGIEQSLRGV
jgi:uncharacterized protein